MKKPQFDCNEARNPDDKYPEQIDVMCKVLEKNMTENEKEILEDLIRSTYKTGFVDGMDFISIFTNK